MAKKYYAYYVPSNNTKGICDNWNECKNIVHGVKADYKSFLTYYEAENWLNSLLSTSNKTENKNIKSNKFYACFYVEENRGEIVFSWSDCQKKIKEKKSRYKSFTSQKEAEEWILNGGEYTNKKEIQENLPEGIYFDAGTGRGIGVEVRVTDKYGNSLLKKYFSHDVNEYDNFLMPENSTNNFGELKGLDFALDIAVKENCFNIYGDSSLVINYWSKGLVKKDNVNEETYKLALKVTGKREFFESVGGSVSHISGDFNPADLGFHK